MILIKLTNIPRNWPQLATIINTWCKEQGLIREQDYQYYFKLSESAMCFKFHDENSAITSLFVLRWGQYL